MALVLEARSLSKRFFLHHRSRELKTRFLSSLQRRRVPRDEEFWALRDISLKVARGDSLGLVGRNGSGKSTLLKIIAGIHPPTSGQLLLARGARVGSMIELGIGFHPELTGEENVFMNTAIHGLSRAEARAIYDAVVDYSGLRHFMDVPLKNYSSGMHMRLGFSIVAQLDPDVLLLDEIFAVGDEDFQKQCTQTLAAFQERGKTIVFVSHSTAAVHTVCRRACVVDRGRLVYDGSVGGALNEYRRLNMASPHTPIGTEPARPAPERRESDLAWHRAATGGDWTTEGVWVHDFLRAHGLRPDHFLLEVGCGSLSAAMRLLPYLQQSRYWGFEKNIELYIAGAQIELPRAGVQAERGHFVVNEDFDFSEVPHDFDFAIANAFFRRLSLNGVARCMASVVRKLAPAGRFYATWADNPSPDRFDPIRWPDGSTTYSDREPYHYSFDLLSAVADAAGARVERLADTSHPRGESVMLLTRQ